MLGVKILENPEQSSVHCLVAFGACKPTHPIPYGPRWTADNNRLLLEMLGTWENVTLAMAAVGWHVQLFEANSGYLFTLLHHPVPEMMVLSLLLMLMCLRML